MPLLSKGTLLTTVCASKAGADWCAGGRPPASPLNFCFSLPFTLHPPSRFPAFGPSLLPRALSLPRPFSHPPHRLSLARPFPVPRTLSRSLDPLLYPPPPFTQVQTVRTKLHHKPDLHDTSPARVQTRKTLQSIGNLGPAACLLMLSMMAPRNGAPAATHGGIGGEADGAHASTLVGAVCLLSFGLFTLGMQGHGGEGEQHPGVARVYKTPPRYLYLPHLHTCVLGSTPHSHTCGTCTAQGACPRHAPWVCAPSAAAASPALTIKGPAAARCIRAGSRVRLDPHRHLHALCICTLWHHQRRLEHRRHAVCLPRGRHP
eukprot:357242-Chlamydomonas_euryale.AAC.2